MLLSNKQAVLLIAALASSMLSAVTGECLSTDSPSSPECIGDETNNLREFIPQQDKVEPVDGCLEVAFLGEDYLDEDVIDAVIVANANECGADLCFDPAAGSISTTNQTALVAALGNFDVLLVMNLDNLVPPLTLDTKTAVEAALTSGTLKKVMVYDRYAAYDDGDVNVPGLNVGDVVRNLDNDQEPILVDVPPITGPGGVIGAHDGNYASHGYINQTADIFLDPATEEHYRQLQNGETTTVQYCYEASVVYYSTIPMDFHLPRETPPYASLFTNAVCHLAASECSAVQNCKRWLSRCETREECCSGYCRLGRCRLLGLPFL